MNAPLPRDSFDRHMELIRVCNYQSADHEGRIDDLINAVENALVFTADADLYANADSYREAPRVCHRELGGIVGMKKGKA
jgi:hypothetical protein